MVRSWAIAGGLAALAAGIAFACGDSTGVTIYTDGGSTDGGDAGGGTTTDAGSSGNVDAGGPCDIVAGNYHIVLTSMPSGNDVDAASPQQQGVCTQMSTTDSMLSTLQPTMAPPQGCTSMTSTDGCTVTSDCTHDNAGSTVTTHEVLLIAADRQSATDTTHFKTTVDDAGPVLVDCTLTKTYTKK
jgi:hypothetical protein